MRVYWSLGYTLDRLEPHKGFLFAGLSDKLSCKEGAYAEMVKRGTVRDFCEILEAIFNARTMAQFNMLGLSGGLRNYALEQLIKKSARKRKA